MKIHVKRITAILLCFIMVVSSAAFFSSCSDKQQEQGSQGKPELDYVVMTDGVTENKVVDEKSAIEAVAAVAETLGISDVEKELKVADVNKVDEDSYYRMQQYYEGIPVYGKTVVLSADAEGNTTALTSNTSKIENIDVTPSVSQEKVDAAVKEYFDDEKAVIESIGESKLYIYNLDETIPSTLVYKLAVLTETGAYDIFIDAKNTEIVKSYSSMYYAQQNFELDGQKKKQKFVAEAESNMNYMKYLSEKGTQINVYIPQEDNPYTWYQDLDANIVSWNNAKAADKSAVDALTNMTYAYNFYDDILGRNSFDGKGSPINTYVHVIGYRDYDGDDHAKINNAFHWGSPNGVVFAFTKRYNGTKEIEEYSADVDVVAHEYTHGVEKTISGMVYEGESGAIMEAYSDIFGEIVEDYAINGQLDGDCNWRNGGRNLEDPSSSPKTEYACYYLDQGKECPFVKSKNNHVYNEKYTITKQTCLYIRVYPEKYKDEYFLTTQNVLNDKGESINDNGGVHTNNTVISHAAYLMWNGIDGTANRKINTETLAKLWYRAMHLLQSNATFEQCANAVILAAQQMYQDNENTFTINQLGCVKSAFEKVGITSNIVGSILAENGSTIFAMDITKYKSYDNYHLDINNIDLSSRQEVNVVSVDITDDKGYTFDLEEGLYSAVVKDNAINGSKYEYSITIRVIDDFPGDNELKIYTDFKELVAVTDFTIPTDEILTLGELSVIEPEIVPEDATDYTIEWSSSDESIATVSPTGEAGIITSLAKGTTTITAKLTSGGKTITKTTNLRVASKSRDTILVLDVSGSMYGTPMEEMKKSAIQFCKDLLQDEYNNRVGLVFYDDGITTVNLTDDLNQLIYEIEAISDGGLTNMEAGLSTADTMMQNQGKSDAIKNVVIMADGLPNDGKTSYSGSMPSGSYSSYYNSVSYANAVIDTAKDMMTRYNMYSLGFFHSLYDEEKDFGVALMQQLTNQEDGYHQVDNAEDLQFAFGDISETINVGSKIVINIACPVDVEVSYGGEKLSSAADSYCDSTSFGTLQVLGKNKDIKVVSLDDDKEYEVKLTGTGEGTMDYSVCYFDENEKMSDYRSFEAVPITMTTVIKSNTNNDKDVTLNIDEDGDGEVDTIWTAVANSVGEITFQKYPPELEEISKEISEDTSYLTIILVIVAIIVIAGCTAGIIVAVSFRGRNQKSEEDIISVKEQEKPETYNKGAETEDKETEDKTPNIGRIQVTSGSMNGFSVSIHDGETLYLGRDPKFANIVITEDYAKVSRIHCTVTYNAEFNKYYVTDCSRNGTFLISRKRLPKGKRTPLNSNTILILANDNCTILLG